MKKSNACIEHVMIAGIKDMKHSKGIQFTPRMAAHNYAPK